ncbi:hypothetical protein EKH57_11640 [Halorubrum sp. BOL3-1]|uniref:hypothetical protein n=1 Tax=Halorubrum sp. BOL3-1 TaxID=2497325 RepID=UPI0010050851|nr:hypothetical protein [Halorubrum sp. BOL3-1]QAU13317.1 hypothetical protein EKH57_11640 [Halorubrum sp. BOL3-1]
MNERITSILLIAVVAFGAMTGVAAAENGLGVTVDDADGEPTVTVTHNDTAVENGTVNVTVVDPANESYAGAGEYETDADGTVDLPAAEENVTVEVTAEYENESVSTTVDLTAGETDEGDEGTPFGQLIRDFIENISDRDGGIGGAVSDFATGNNPGNASDHAGGPDDAAGNASDENASAPGNAPDHAGPDGDDADGDDANEDDTEESEADADEDGESDAEDDEDADEDDGESGPPDHAGGSGGN